MIKCKDCGGSISSSAYKCPKCGAVTDHYCRTVEDQNEGGTWFLGIFAVIFIIGLIISFIQKNF